MIRLTVALAMCALLVFGCATQGQSGRSGGISTAQESATKTPSNELGVSETGSTGNQGSANGISADGTPALSSDSETFSDPKNVDVLVTNTEDSSGPALEMNISGSTENRLFQNEPGEDERKVYREQAEAVRNADKEAAERRAEKKTTPYNGAPLYDGGMLEVSR